MTTRTTSLWSRLVVALLMALVAVVAPLLTAPAHATVRGDGLRAAANERRASGGLPAVPGTDLLDSIADARADQMASARKLEHDMDYVRNRLNSAGACWTGFGEIIASSGYADYSYQNTVTQWWNSPTHKAIMMSESYNAAGGSWERSSNGTYYSVMVFATLCGSALTQSTSLLATKQTYDPDRRMVFRAGTHTAYQFSSTGAILDKKTITLGRSSGADSMGRTKLDGKAWLKVANGAFAGFWVRERAKSFVRGMTEKHTFSGKRLAFAAGTYTGYKFDSLGRVTASRSYTLSRSSGADAAAKAVINGQRYWLIKNGVWTGYWVKDTKSVNPA